MSSWLRIAGPLSLAAAVCFNGACGDDAETSGPVAPAPPGEPWKKLSQWRLFSDLPGQVPNERVFAYGVTSPLFTDYAAKLRFFWVPEGTTITYHDDAAWDLPLGSIVVKSFGFPVDARDDTKGVKVLETRLLVRGADGWIPHTYIWDANGKDAHLEAAGAFLTAEWIDADGVAQSHRYVVPNTNECQDCHGKKPDTRVLGLKTAQLEGLPGENLIDAYAAAGLFASAPTPSNARPKYHAPDDESASLSDRARAYFDANCSHCHSDYGDAKAKALYLDFAHTDPATSPPKDWGVCKIPTSAGGSTCGYTYDIVPGDSAHSVMICRMLSTVGADQMPPLGRGLVHTEGVALIRAWIDAMEPDDCR